MDPLLLIGPIAVVLVYVFTRVHDVPGDVKQHDQRIRNRDADLATWIVDDDRATQEEIEQRTAEAAMNGVTAGGALVQIPQKVTRHTQQRYRDQLIDAQRVVTDIDLSERWVHRLWRKIVRRPRPELTAPARHGDTLDRWAETAGSWEQALAA